MKMNGHDSSTATNRAINMNMTILVKVMSGKREEFIQAISSLEGDFVRKQKVAKPVLYQKVDDRTAFSLVCELPRQEDMKELLDTEEFKILLGALTVLCEESEILYSYVSRNRSVQPHGTLEEAPPDEPSPDQDLEAPRPEPKEWEH